jgi:hypothetical protein
MTDKDFYAKRNPVTGEFYDPRMQPRFTELATFMRAPVADDLSAIDIGLIGVPQLCWLPLDQWEHRSSQYQWH